MKKINYRRFFTTIGAVLSVIAFLYILSVLNTRKDFNDSVDFGKGWTIELPQGTYNDVDVDSFAFNALQTGDRFVLENQLPLYGFVAPQVRFWMCHSAFDVYLDGRLIYTYGKAALINHDMINNGYHWIDIPQDACGKTIRLEGFVNEPNALNNFDKLIICDAKNSMADLISDNLISLVAGVFLAVFGVCIIIVAIILNGYRNEFMPLVYTGIFALLIGIWGLTNKGLLQIITTNRDITMVCEYFCLYLGPLPILLFFYRLRKEEKAKALVLPVKVLIVVNILMVAVTIVIHKVGILHFPSALQYFHIFDAVVVLYIIVTCLYNLFAKRKNDESFLLMGVFLLALCFTYDVLIFNLGKYVNGEVNHLVGATSIGGIIFAICMLFSFGNYLLRGIATRIQTETLMKLAYTDSLTGLYNRTKYSEIEENLDCNDNSDYTLINFDVNGLKTTNDTSGHSMGDNLLKAFANVLNKSFDQSCIICRMGGDEFNIIIYGCDRSAVNDYMKQYEVKLAEENEQISDFNIEAAWGVAYSDEVPNEKFHTVNKLADKRMYEKKAQMKNGANFAL